MTEQTRTRRSKWQIQAAKKYPRLTYIGGDGGGYECWVVLTKCPHDQTRHWRYALCPGQTEAEALLETWAKSRCSYSCQGKAQHQLWKLL